jgi:hypothetical protein
MSDDAHNRWLSIVDRETTGRPLSQEDAAFCAQYEAEHTECGREREQWNAMIHHLGRSADEAGPSPALAEAVLTAHRARNAGETRSGPRWPALGAAAGLALAAGIALLWVVERAPAPSAPSRDVALPGPGAPELAVAEDLAEPARIVLAAPDGPKVEGKRAAVGDVVTAGSWVETAESTVCMQHLGPVAVTCMAPRTRVRLGATASELRELALEHGRVLAILDPLPPGHRFRVVARAGSVTALGTVFTVEARGDGRMRAAVHRGAVEVALGHTRTRLEAHEGIRAGAEPAILEPASEPPFFSTDGVELWRSSRHGVLELAGDAAGATGSVDGVALGPLPLSLALAPGTHAIEISGEEPVHETVEISAGAIVTRSYEPSGRRPSPRANSERQRSIEDLLDDARKARRSSRWRAAETIYRELIATYPQSAAAQTTRVVLGDLLLDELDDPQAALRAYEGYLRAGGSIDQEARLGQIRALRRLDRPREELEAIEAFLALHRGSMHAPELRARSARLRAGPGQ